MSDHIANLASKCTRLEAVGLTFEELLKMIILIASLHDCKEYSAISSSIYIMRAETTTWAYVPTIVMEE